VPRLDAARLELWRDLSRFVSESRLELDRRLTAEANVSLSEFDVLALLDRTGGRCRLADVATEIGLTRSATTRVIDRLDAAGLVHRDLVSVDGRGVDAVLTAKGGRFFRRVRPLYRRAVHGLITEPLTATDLSALQRVVMKWRPGD
jgi:DNA-binding MarR family transcriptional regulator